MTDMNDDDDYDNTVECSYCGKLLYAGVTICPKCGNYTDGNGPRASPTRGGKPLPKYLVIAGWLVVICFVIPVLIQLFDLIKRYSK